jgi:Flp pilus assembly protein TadD
MNQPFRFGSAASLVVLGSMIAGCAAPHAHVGSATHIGGKADQQVPLGTQALAALNSNNVPMAIDLAERAAAKTPTDATIRTLLGNAYFAGGRFHSAEAAFKDSLTLDPSQSQVILKLALVDIAQGKNRDAVAILNAGRSMLDASDLGLALALAGHPAEAIAVLESAARQQGADATVRQNLALAHALSGDWDEARTIAAQDVPADQLDTRIHQWMQLANPAHASDQVAALVGVTPAAVDAGQPVQLALNKGETEQAEVTPAPAPAPAPQKVAQVSPAPAPAPKAVAVAAAAPVSPVAAAPAKPVPPAPPPQRPTLATLAVSAFEEAKAAVASILPQSRPAPAKPHRAVATVQRAAVRHGNSPAVVQLGAYGSAARVLAAWNGASHKYGALRAYLPLSARFATPKGTFYRLSVRGFSSVGEANSLCTSLRHEGGNCFVRNFAGDQPVQFASR